MDGLRCRNESMAREKNLVAGSDTRRSKTEKDRIGTVRHTNGMLDIQMCPYLGFEIRNILLKDEPALTESPVDEIEIVLTILKVKFRPFKKWNLHLRLSGCICTMIVRLWPSILHFDRHCGIIQLQPDGRIGKHLNQQIHVVGLTGRLN